MAENNDIRYWQVQAENARRQAAANLRTAAQRATEIEQLKKRLAELEAMMVKIQAAETQINLQTAAQICEGWVEE